MLLENFNVSMVTHLTPEKEPVTRHPDDQDAVKLEENDSKSDEEDEELWWIDEELRNHEDRQITPTPPYLPALTSQTPRYCLVVDLDETLIHYNEKENYYLVWPGVN